MTHRRRSSSPCSARTSRSSNSTSARTSSKPRPCSRKQRNKAQYIRAKSPRVIVGFFVSGGERPVKAFWKQMWRCEYQVQHPAMGRLLRRRRGVKQQRAHEQGIAGFGCNRLFVRLRARRDFGSAKDAVGVTTRDD